MKKTPIICAECEATRQHKIICRLTAVIVLMSVLFTGYVIYVGQHKIVRKTAIEIHVAEQGAQKEKSDIKAGDIKHGEF